MLHGKASIFEHFYARHLHRGHNTKATTTAHVTNYTSASRYCVPAFIGIQVRAMAGMAEAEQPLKAQGQKPVKKQTKKLSCTCCGPL